MRLTITCAFILVTMATRARAQNVNCANPVDVMFLMDGSDSIDASEWSKEKDFVARIVMALDISPSTVNVGFTVYSSDIHTHTGLNPFQPKVVLNAKIRNVEHPTGIATNTAMGIAHVTQTLKEQPRTRANAPKIMIVITDGTSVNPAETIRQAQDAKASGITIIAVGIGNTAFVEELREISSSPQHYYQAPDFDTLRGIETQIRNIICRVVTTTRAPIFVPPTQPPSLVPIQGNINCNNPADIIFLIDGSDSISDQDYVRLKSFVATLIENFEVSQQAIHVGLIVYSSAIGDKVPLSPFKNKFLLKALARNLNHPRLGTDTGGGLEAASNMIREQGRKNVPEMIVVITDGRSTIPYKTIMQAAKAKAEGITLIAIGVGKDIFSQELNVIASGPKYVSEVADFTSLESIINAMRDLICTAITTPTPITTTMMPITPPPSIDPPDSGLICTVPGDVIFVLDGSNSIHPNDWIRQRNFVSNLINNLEIGRQYIHVAVVVYSTGIGEVIPLVPFQPQSVLSNRVGKLVQPSYGTDTALGIERARQILTDQGRKDAPNVVIVVTDGKSTHPDRTHIQSMMAKADGVTMFAVGVGPDVFEDEMHNIASSGAQVFKVADFVSLQSIIKVLRDKICQVVQTTTSAPATMPTTTMPTTTVMVTPSLVQLYPCDESRTEADIMFLVGGTKTMSPYDWMMSKHLAANFLDGLAIAREFSHVGVVVSDSGRSDTIGMSPFKAKKYLQEMFRGLLHPDGDMDTATGLRKIQNFFDASGRPSSKKLVVYLTNGASASPADAAREADIMKRKGVDIVTMGIGNRLNSAELQALASKPTLTFSSPDSVSSFRRLPELQRAVCELLRKPITTTQAPTTPSCLIDSGTGYNPVAGDCTRYVQCWRDGPHIRALVRSCPFGQFWDADAITCRPSFLVRCSADPCRSADSMFTYSMPEYGCRGYWKCIDGFSVGHCCPAGSAYVDGMGCRETSTCSEMCPPRGGVAVNPTCDRKPHWDSRYYIEIVYGRGEIVRPCPAGTIFYEKKCECDFGMSGLLPATPHVQCQPAASFPFNLDLMDKSQFGSNVGINGVRRTDLGTAHFNHNGTSNMNLWRFAGGDWGNQLVIKFKFRFDFSNKLVDYGGIPVDLGGPDMDLGLVSDYHMTDIDWRLWDRLRQIRSLEDWRRLLNEFGQSRTFYIFLGTLGFKPGTSNSHQVLSILSTPEAYAQFQILLDQMQGRLNADVNIDRATSGGLREILTLLRSMRDVIDWGLITRRLRGEETVTVPPNAIAHLTGTGEYLWDGRSSMWIRTAPSGTLPIPPTVTWQGADEHLLNIGGTETASEWRFNEKSGQWERYAAIDIGGGHHGQYEWLTASDARAAGEQTSQTSGNAGVEFWQWNATGSQQPIRASTSVNGTGSYAATRNSSGGIAGMSWQDILNMLNDAQNKTSGTWQWTTHGTSGDTTRAANQQALEALMRQFNIGGGGSGGVGGSATWQWNASVDRPTSQGFNQSTFEAMLKELRRRVEEARLAELGASLTGGWNFQTGGGVTQNLGGTGQIGGVGQADGWDFQMGGGAGQTGGANMIDGWNFQTGGGAGQTGDANMIDGWNFQTGGGAGQTGGANMIDGWNFQTGGGAGQTGGANMIDGWNFQTGLGASQLESGAGQTGEWNFLTGGSANQAGSGIGQTDGWAGQFGGEAGVTGGWEFQTGGGTLNAGGMAGQTGGMSSQTGGASGQTGGWFGQTGGTTGGTKSGMAGSGFDIQEFQRMVQEMAARMQGGATGGSAQTSFNLSGEFSPSGNTFTGSNVESTGLDTGMFKSLLQEMARENAGGSGYFNMSGEFMSTGGSASSGSIATSKGNQSGSIESILQRLAATYGIAPGMLDTSGIYVTATGTGSGGATGGATGGAAGFDVNRLNVVLQQLSDLIRVNKGQNTGNMGENNFEGGSKRTVQVRVENERPVSNNQIAGGRVVGGSFGVGFQGGSEGGGGSGGEGAFSQGSQTFSRTVGAPFEQGSNAHGAIEAAGIDFVVFPVNTEPVAGPAQSEVKTISQTVRISNVRPTNTANNVKRVQTFSQSGGGGAALNSYPQAVNNVEATVMTGSNSIRFDEPPASSSRDIDNVEGTMQTGSVSIMLNRPTDTVSTSQTGNNFEAAVQTEREARIVNIPTVNSSKGSNTVEVTVQSGGGSRIINVPTVSSSKGSSTVEATFTAGGDSRMLNIPNVSSSQAVKNVETTVITGNDARTFNGPSQSTSRAINNIEATVIRGSDARIANRPSENVSTSQGMAKIQSTSRTGSGGTFTINSSADGGNAVFTSERKDQPVSGSRNVVTIKQSVQGGGGSGGGSGGSAFADMSGIPRGAGARGVSRSEEGRFMGIHVPESNSGFISGASIVGGGSASGSSSLSRSSGGASGTQVLTDVSGMSGGDFTQMGKVVGSGGGIRRVIDTNMKRLPAGDVSFNADGGVNLASLGIDGKDAANIIRKSVRIESAGDGQIVGGAIEGGGGEFVSGGSGQISGGQGGGFSFSSGSRSGGGGFTGGGGSMSAGGGMSVAGGSASGRAGGVSGWQSGNLNVNELLPLLATENVLDGMTAKRRRKRSLRNKRQVGNTRKQEFQALVTNCQGRGQGPSIMVVANQNEVKMALKTYHNDPVVVNVPAVEGWNDVTMIYDGKTLTGIVENWQGFNRASTSLKGNVETRQTGLLVGSCEGFQSFSGEMDDLTVYKCLSPAIMELRDRVLRK